MPSAAGYNHYVEIVRKQSVLRQIIITCGDTITKAYDKDSDENILGATEKAIYEIAERDQSGSLERIEVALGSVINRIEEIHKNHAHADKAHEYLIIAKKYEILHFLYKNEYLADESSLLEPINLKAILPVVEFINNNYQKQITLYDISKHLCLHRNYLCRLFKQSTGKTVMDYLTFVRMCNAEILLKTNKSIAEIADLTGFSSPEYFNKVFKNHFFYTPSEYRNKYLKSNYTL